jgi:DNA-binding LacI/PurR family transcriptional regulator
MPGIKDVARACGVSPATVSQVLGGGKRPVREATRQRIIAVSNSIGYRPNAIARGLVKKRMNTFGVVIQHATQSAHTNPALISILDGILSVGTRTHQQVTLITYYSWGEANDALSTICDGRCDGALLVVPPEESNLSQGLLERQMPFVLIGTHSEDPNISYVDIDNIGAGEAAIDYLLQQGHRRIAFISLFLQTYQFDLERLVGYRQALEKAGVTVDANLIMCNSDLEKTIGQLLQMPREMRPTALFCTNDECAMRVIHLLAEKGQRVPEDFSIVGFDDTPSAAMISPPLTTINQPMTLLGECAAELLLAQINNPQESPEKRILPTELIVRRSVLAIG